MMAAWRDHPIRPRWWHVVAIIALGLLAHSLSGCDETAGTVREVAEAYDRAEDRVDQASIDRWCRKPRHELAEHITDPDLVDAIVQACAERAAK